MRSSGAISASDYSLIGPDRQCSGEKPHRVFAKLPFQPLIDNLISCSSPEISTFSNNAGRDIWKYVLVAVPGGGLDKWYGVPAREIPDRECDLPRNKQNPDDPAGRVTAQMYNRKIPCVEMNPL